MFTTLIAAVLAAAPQSECVVHEWGTFTEVIDADGAPLDWFRPLVTEPLPAFVHGSAFGKAEAMFRVRMETPVVYFHVAQPGTYDVRVALPGGLLTEFYPAAVFDGGSLAWRVLVDPRADWRPPVELGGDHYYAARGVAAAPLTALDDAGTPEHEKFLFYRGVASFELPLRVRQEGPVVRVINEGDLAFSRVFLFERRAEGAWVDDLGALRPGASAAVDRAQKQFGGRVALGALEEALVAEGLYRDEAAAMIETWRSSWFGDGLRLLFTLPRAKTDELLPLSISPVPQHVERVMVGRFEIVTQEARDELLALSDELGHRDIPDDRMAAAASRFGRVACAVLYREAARWQETQPDRAAVHRVAADRFVRWQMDSSVAAASGR